MKQNAFRVVFFLGMSFLMYQISQYVFGDWPTDEQLDQSWDYVKETFDDPDKAKNDIQSEIDKINPQSDLDRMQSKILEKYESKGESSYWGSSKSEAVAISNGIKIYTEPYEKGETPIKIGDKIYIGYSGHFMDGKVFETNIDYVAKREGLYEENRLYAPLIVEVGKSKNVLPGFMEALKTMNLGDRSYLFVSGDVPSSQINGNVPPNRDLVYVVEILRAQDLITFGNRPWDSCFEANIYEEGYLSGTPTLSLRNLADRKVEGHYMWVPPAEMGTWGGAFTGKYVQEDLISASGYWSEEGENYEVSFTIRIKPESITVDHPYILNEVYTLKVANCEEQLF